MSTPKEIVLPDRIVGSGDAGATAANLLGHPMLLRVSFATYLVEETRLSAFFGLASMVIYAVARSSFFAASLAVGDSAGMASFAPDQRNVIVQHRQVGIEERNLEGIVVLQEGTHQLCLIPGPALIFYVRQADPLQPEGSSNRAPGYDILRPETSPT